MTSATVFAVVISVIWTLGLINEPTYVEVSATIVAEEDDYWIESEAEITGDGTNGTGWFMDDISGWYESCYTDEDGYEYCDSYFVTEYECYADLHLSWNGSGTVHYGWTYTPSIITPYDCLKLMEDYYEIGKTIPIWYAGSDPSQFQAFTIGFGVQNLPIGGKQCITIPKGLICTPITSVKQDSHRDLSRPYGYLWPDNN